jgi:cold shock CspA family protein
MAPSVHRLHLGRVVSFDVDVGLGEVETAAGERFAFQCTAITDGTRRIDAGTPVAFRVGPGGPGRWEASEVTPTG